MDSQRDPVCDRRILIVDDCDDIRANLTDILQEVGYRVDQAHDGYSALDLVEKNLYAIVLLDFKMPGMDGAKLAQEIKQLCPQTVAIMITAYANGNGAQKVVDSGLVRLLRKPVNLEHLLPLVAEAFRDEYEAN